MNDKSLDRYESHLFNGAPVNQALITKCAETGQPKVIVCVMDVEYDPFVIEFSHAEPEDDDIEFRVITDDHKWITLSQAMCDELANYGEDAKALWASLDEFRAGDEWFGWEVSLEPCGATHDA